MTMVDDFGGYAPVNHYTDGLSRQQLMAENKELRTDIANLQAELEVFRQAPLRRMLSGVKEFLCEWIAPILVVLFGILVGASTYLANKNSIKRDFESCEFAAKIQDTKFEFDKNNKKCYLYDSKFEKYLPYGIKNPD